MCKPESNGQVYLPSKEGIDGVTMFKAAILTRTTLYHEIISSIMNVYDIIEDDTSNKNFSTAFHQVLTPEGLVSWIKAKEDIPLSNDERCIGDALGVPFEDWVKGGDVFTQYGKENAGALGVLEKMEDALTNALEACKERNIKLAFIGMLLQKLEEFAERIVPFLLKIRGGENVQ